MKSYKYSILYTSDAHGAVLSTNYSNNSKDPKGLAGISSFLKTIQNDYMLLDNGDTIQGTPLMDYWMKNKPLALSPINKAMNAMKYDFFNIGNHDFNFGEDIFKQYTTHLDGTVLCCNLLNSRGEHVFSPYAIKTLSNGVRIGVIAAVTHYIPNWEKSEHIKNFIFLDAYESVKKATSILRPQVDLLVVLYHGGFEKDPYTGTIMGRDTDENQGYKIAKDLPIDILLTGHQHYKYSGSWINNTFVMQTTHSAMDFGKIDVTFQKEMEQWRIDQINGTLIKNDFQEDPEILRLVIDDEETTQNWLEQPIGTVQTGDLLINDPFTSKLSNHPIYKFINKIQLEHTNAMISAASLANQSTGFHHQITKRDIESTFVYSNSLVVIEITGEILKDALEKSASYFTIQDDSIVINPAFIYPKIEHYNYDIYEGIDYTISISKQIGSKITSLTYQGKNVTEKDRFTLVLTNYRAVGGGDYHMFKNSKVVKEYDQSLSTLVTEYIEKNKLIIGTLSNNLTIIK